MKKTEAGRTMSVRTRILTATLLVVALALCAIIVVTGRSLFARVEADAAAELTHEVEKLRSFAETAAAQGTSDVRTLLTDFLAQNVSETNETQFSIVDGRSDRRSRVEPPVRMDASETFVSEIGSTTQPVSGRIDTAAGPAVYTAVPVVVHADPTRGVLVTIEFLGPSFSTARSTVLVMALAAVFALLLAAWAGWLVTGRALRPITEVRETAAEIGGGDLHRRIRVTGTDDAAQLAVTFNLMLDRLQASFDGQRRFLDDAGHELRTPITVIRGHLELMGEGAAERTQTLHLVTDELQRMSRLVDDLILLARAERLDFLVLADVDLADLVVETLSKASTLGQRAWSLDAVPEGTARLDAQRLTQALLQLAANAVAHTDPGDPIAFGGVLDAHGLRLWVRDGGRGISATDQERIFDRFARGAGARRGTGSGLGLAIVGRIADAHCGTVAVESAPGHGATFTITLPMPPKDTR